MIKKNLSWNLLKKLGNLNFSITMLLFIALFSIIGTLIEQDQSVNTYQLNYPINNNKLLNIDWRLILNLQLDHVYTTWWFLSLLTLFFSSLIVCTFSIQLPALRNARKWKFLQSSESIQKIKDYICIPFRSFSNIIYVLNNQHYYVFHKKHYVYAYKGLFGRLAPIFVHLGIILTLVGSMTGLLGGFSVQEIVPNGEVFHLQNRIKTGRYSQIPYNIIGKVNDFKIEYNPDHSIKQFFSTISLLDNNYANLKTETIAVNSPLVFKGVTFYQTDWQINALRIELINNQIIQEPLTKIKNNNTPIWFYNFPIALDDYISIVVTSLEGGFSVYSKNGLLLTESKLNESVTIDGKTFIIREIMTSTGLQMKTDPGIGIVYTSFFVLMVSVVISYLSYSQIWIHGSLEQIELAGSTNRAALTFEEDLKNIYRKYLHLRS